MTAVSGTDRQLARRVCAQEPSPFQRLREAASGGSRSWAFRRRMTKSGASPMSRRSRGRLVAPPTPARRRCRRSGAMAAGNAPGLRQWTLLAAGIELPEGVPAGIWMLPPRNTWRSTRAYEKPFVALNTAFLNDGALRRVARGTVIEEPIQSSMSDDRDGSCPLHPRTLIVVGAGRAVHHRRNLRRRGRATSPTRSPRSWPAKARWSTITRSR